MMDARWVAGAIALSAALLFTPMVRSICMRVHLYDLPGPLKIHSHPIPRLGGISLTLAFALALSSAKYFSEFSAWPLLMALTTIWLTGLADDVRGLSPWVRLVTQIASATLLWHEGWRLPLLGGAFSWMATCLFVIVFVNALNFLDGADGLAAGSAAIVTVGYVALPAGMLSHLGVAVACSLLGASLGFLAFNFPPARIFLGDSGSTVLGFALAFLALDSCRAGASANSLPLFPVIFAAVPLLDAAFAVLRRLRNHNSPLAGDRRHFYDLLLARGWSPRRVSFICYSITAALVAAGWLSVRGGFAQAVWISALCFVALLAAALWLGALRSCGAVSGVQEAKTAAFSGNVLASAECTTIFRK